MENNRQTMRKMCHACGAAEGELHDYGCDVELCSICGEQLISCNCIYEILEIDCSPNSYVYKYGPSGEQKSRWLEIMEEKGRIPYVRIPFLCSLCGTLYPNMFLVSDDEWDKYVIPELQRTILCKHCYVKQQKLFPNGWRAPSICMV